MTINTTSLSKKYPSTFVKPLSIAIHTSLLSIVATQTVLATENVVDLGSTIVTGQKIDRTLQKTITGTSLIDDISIEEASAQNLDEVLDVATNIDVVETGNYNSFSIRGINGNGGGTELSSMLLNGAYLPVAAFRGNLALWDMEQIVVNKGPQSTTQGRNALAGTIIMQTKDPEFDNKGSVRVGMGSHGAKNAAVMLNGKISDNFAVRLSAQRNQEDGQITNVYLNDEEHDFSENTSANLKLFLNLSDATQAKLSLGYIEDGRGVRLTCDEENSTPTATCSKGERKANQAIKPHHDFKTDFQTLELSHQFNSNWSAKSITSRTHIDEDSYEDWTRYNPETPNYPRQNGQLLDPSESYDGWKRDTLSQEFRVNFENDKLRTSTGLYGAKNETRRFREGQTPYDFADFLGALDSSGSLTLEKNKEFFPLSLSEKNGIYDVDTLAIFNDTDFDVNDKLTINAGLRLEQEKVTVRSDLITARASDLTGLDQSLPNSITTPVQLDPSLPPQQVPLAAAACAQNAALCGAPLTTILGAFSGQSLPGLNDITDGFLASTVNQAGNQKVNKETNTILPKLGFSYDVSDNTTVGYLYSRGYRSGGAGINLGTGTTYEYKPEYLDNHEISVRSTSADKRFSVNGNLYFADWTDQQVTVNGGTGPYDRYTANAGESQLYGFELETKYTHGNGLYGFANFALSETEYKKFETDGNDYSGNEFADAPNYKTAFGVGYYASNGLNGNITTTTTTGSYQNADNERKSPAYTMTDLRLGYEADVWRVNAYVNNLFDRKVEHRYWNFDNQSFASQYVYLPERNFGVNVQYDF